MRIPTNKEQWPKKGEIIKNKTITKNPSIGRGFHKSTSAISFVHPFIASRAQEPPYYKQEDSFW